MTKLQQVNKIVIKMLNKHENQRKESRNVAIGRKFTKICSKNEQLINKTWSITQYVRKQQIFVRNVIIEGALHENKMAGKGQITSERARQR